MSIRSKWVPTVALAFLLPLTACGGAEEGTDEMEGMEQPAPAAAPSETEGMQPTSIMLEAKNESGVTGEATARHQADSVTVEMSISGASQEGAYPAHVHMGDCQAPGEVMAGLNSFDVTGGSGSSTTTIAASEVPEGQQAVIQVHDPSGAPVACGDLRGHGGMGGMGEGGMAGDTAGM